MDHDTETGSTKTKTSWVVSPSVIRGCKYLHHFHGEKEERREEKNCSVFPLVTRAPDDERGKRGKRKRKYLSVGVSELVWVESSLPTEFKLWHWAFRPRLDFSHDSITPSWIRFWNSRILCRSCSSICCPKVRKQRNSFKTFSSISSSVHSYISYLISFMHCTLLTHTNIFEAHL